MVSDEHRTKTLQWLYEPFQSALRFAVVSDEGTIVNNWEIIILRFQSALRFAVVSDIPLAVAG